MFKTLAERFLETEMVPKRIECAGKELLWEHSAFPTGKGCGFESPQSSLPVQREASPGYLNIVAFWGSQ